MLKLWWSGKAVALGPGQRRFPFHVFVEGPPGGDAGCVLKEIAITVRRDGDAEGERYTRSLADGDAGVRLGSGEHWGDAFVVDLGEAATHFTFEAMIRGSSKEGDFRLRSAVPITLKATRSEGEIDATGHATMHFYGPTSFRGYPGHPPLKIYMHGPIQSLDMRDCKNVTVYQSGEGTAANVIAYQQGASEVHQTGFEVEAFNTTQLREVTLLPGAAHQDGLDAVLPLLARLPDSASISLRFMERYGRAAVRLKDEYTLLWQQRHRYVALFEVDPQGETSQYHPFDDDHQEAVIPGRELTFPTNLWKGVLSLKLDTVGGSGDYYYFVLQSDEPLPWLGAGRIVGRDAHFKVARPGELFARMHRLLRASPSPIKAVGWAKQVVLPEAS